MAAMTLMLARFLVLSALALLGCTGGAVPVDAQVLCLPIHSPTGVGPLPSLPCLAYPPGSSSS